jgi:hypothetical protein
VSVTTPDDDERRTDDAWRSIVENYGERADLDGDAPEPAVQRAVERSDVVIPDVVEPAPVAEPAEERFVPPPPPPLPRPEPKRAVAWAGVFGAPAILLLLLVLGVSLPALLDYALVAWFVGGFVYLVATMPSGPRDPGDDGSRI